MKYTSIKIWPGEFAPIEYKNLLKSENPANAWIMFVPKELNITTLPFNCLDWHLISLDWDIRHFDDHTIYIYYPKL